ncbi:MAG: Crp/Fnr family transcriptional regulator, partial [Chloroflexi bacterium]|nr:Crp/Fnr family transcriptional regulator [Chloroflexota bacterium]
RRRRRRWNRRSSRDRAAHCLGEQLKRGPMEQEVWNLRNVNLFNGLSEDDKLAIMHTMPMEAYSADEFLFHAGDKADCLFVLLTGTVKVSYLTLNGEEKILNVFQAGDIFGDLFLGKYRSRIGTAQAMEDVIVCRLSEADFLALVTQFPQVALNFIQHQANQHRETIARMQALMGMNARHRLFGTLLGMARLYCCTDTHWFTLHESLNQEDLANMAGLVRTTVSSLINEFRREGLLGGTGRHITVNRVAIARALEDAGVDILE